MNDNCQDNCIEWLTGQKEVSITFSQKKYINKLKKYARDHPTEVKIIAENNDGSICAHVPLSWVKFSPPRQGRKLSDEEKAAVGERLLKARQEKELSNESD